MDKNKKSIVMFLAFTFGVSWIIMIGCIIAGLRYGDGIMGNVIKGLLIVPGLASLLVRKINDEGFETVRIKPRFKGHILNYVVIYFLPALAIITGAMLYFMVRGGLNPQNTIQEFANSLSLSGGQEVSLAAAESTFYVDILVQVIFAPLAYVVFTFFEVLGFFGYLLPKLTNLLNPPKAMLITGGLWGIWYIPMVIDGYFYGTNYEGYPFAGIGLMFLLCLFFGFILSYYSLKVGSIIPAALAKSAFLALMGIPISFVDPNSTRISEMFMVGPISTGYISMLVFVLIGLLLLLKSRRIQWDADKELAIETKESKATLFSALKKKK